MVLWRGVGGKKRDVMGGEVVGDLSFEKEKKYMESIKQFAKVDINRAVVAEVAQPFFIRYDEHVSHFNVESELDYKG